MNEMDFRPMRRFRQQLPDEECIQILETAYRGFLSVIGDGGYPYTVPLNFVYAEGFLYFHCAVAGHKLDALRACDKACFTVIDEPQQEAGDWWYHVRSVICFGRAHVIEDEQEKDRRLRQLGRNTSRTDTIWNPTCSATPAMRWCWRSASSTARGNGSGRNKRPHSAGTNPRTAARRWNPGLKCK